MYIYIQFWNILVYHRSQFISSELEQTHPRPTAHPHTNGQLQNDVTSSEVYWEGYRRRGWHWGQCRRSVRQKRMKVASICRTLGSASMILRLY